MSATERISLRPARRVTRGLVITTAFVTVLGGAGIAAAQTAPSPTPPPAPALVEPAAAASVVEPFTLR